MRPFNFRTLSLTGLWEVARPAFVAPTDPAEEDIRRAFHCGAGNVLAILTACLDLDRLAEGDRELVELIAQWRHEAAAALGLPRPDDPPGAPLAGPPGAP